MSEFTGERVIAGEVDQDLWNEHIARYHFASRLSRRRRVIDLACGTGYGTAELARLAASATGLDVASEAIQHARANYTSPNLHFLQASCTQVPFPDACFDLVTAFEVIEHLTDWKDLLTEARRLLSRGGQFVVSTPNKSYYAESRRLSGPNPFHQHEFEFDEFRESLAEIFPHVSLFVQNHSYGVVFQPLNVAGPSDVRLETATPNPRDAHFFVAVCALSVQTGAPSFVYLPTTANVLREREHHIAMLEQELREKNGWLEEAQREHQELLGNHRQVTAELEKSNLWAKELNSRISNLDKRIGQLQEELTTEQASARQTVDAYEAKVAELEKESAERFQWGKEIEARVSAELRTKMEELTECLEVLHQTERTLEERTVWAKSLDEQRVDLETRLNLVQASRWHRMGRKLGLGPEVGKP